jgi:molybdenum cofactor biosynthesis protein B
LRVLRAPEYCLVVTSDKVYRGEKRDEVTPLVRSMLEARGRRLAWSVVAPNRGYEIAEAVREAASRCRVVLVTGGTGPSPRDISVDVVERMAVRRLPGLGEEFRRRSLKAAGPFALVSRADAFILPPGSLVFVSPGSPDAVRTALEMLLELDSHLVEEIAGKGHT